MNGNAAMHVTIAIAGEGADSFYKIRGLFRDRNRTPPQLIWRGHALIKWRAAHQALLKFAVGLVHHGRLNAVGPGATVQVARSGKRRAAQLLGVQAER